MGKTYNSKHDLMMNMKTVVFPNGYHKNVAGLYDIDIEPGGTYESGDITYTTFSDQDHAHEKTVRHPNKRKKTNTLGREFITTGISAPRRWRNRFGEEDEKSSRLHLLKRELTQKRRNKLKNEANKIIKRSIEEDE